MNFFTKIFSRKKTVEGALRKFLKKDHRRKLISENPDRRFLVQKIAEWKGISETTVAQEFSRYFKIPFTQRVQAVNVELFPKNLMLSDLRSFGCIPVMQEGILSGLVCAEPTLAREKLTFLRHLPISIALWHTIANALDESERAYLKRRQPNEGSGRDAISLATKVLELIEKECRQYQATECNINIGLDNQANYEFRTNEGKVAKGNIKEKAALSLSDFLAKQVNREPIRLGQSNSTFSVGHLETEDKGLSYKLSWNCNLSVDSLQSVETKQEVQELSNTSDSGLESKVLFFPERANEITSNASSTALVVEDNEVFCRVLERFLSKHNISVVWAKNGKQALPLLAKEVARIDVIICDLHMPDMNGIEFLCNVRSEAVYDDLPILILTSEEDVEAEIELLSLGADAFVSKSEDPRLLCVKLQKLIENFKRKRAA